MDLQRQLQDSKARLAEEQEKQVESQQQAFVTPMRAGQRTSVSIGDELAAAGHVGHTPQPSDEPLREQIAKLEEDVAHLQAQVKDAEAAHRVTKQQLRARDEWVKSLESTVERQQRTIAGNDDKVTDLLRQLEAGQRAAADLRRQLRDAQTERDAVQRQRDELAAAAVQPPPPPPSSQRQLFTSTPAVSPAPVPTPPRGLSEQEAEGWREAVRALRGHVSNLEGELADAKEASLRNMSVTTPRREPNPGASDAEKARLRQEVSEKAGLCVRLREYSRWWWLANNPPPWSRDTLFVGGQPRRPVAGKPGNGRCKGCRSSSSAAQHPAPRGEEPGLAPIAS